MNNKYFENKLSEILKNEQISQLSQYEKRQRIFSHLCDIIRYDFDLLYKINDNEVNKTKIKRNPKEELQNVINNNIGICSSISQYYKLLLEQVGIKSYCVICDDGTPVYHQLTLVYDNESGTYSFDDITSVIVKRGEKQDFFDYDIEYAKSKGQGNKKVMDNEEFFILPEEYINCLVGREKSFSETLNIIPTNISSARKYTNIPLLER